MDKKYILQIYIAGIAPDTQTMIVELKDQLSNTLGSGAYVLKIVDVLEKPQLAEEEHIIATPTMVRMLPSPIKKIILNPKNTEPSTLKLELLLEPEGCDD